MKIAIRFDCQSDVQRVDKIYSSDRNVEMSMYKLRTFSLFSRIQVDIWSQVQVGDITTFS